MKLAFFPHVAALILASLAAGRATPTFEAQTIDDAIAIGYGLAIGDVDGDGKADILLADKTDIVWYRNPSWEKHVMARRLAFRDNVCIAAKDVDGDGKVEVAVGANWNPGETVVRAESGSVHYLIPPDDRTRPWEAVDLPHEPTVHRMHWITPEGEAPRIVVLPLHGVGNRNGEGANGVRVISYAMPEDRDAWADPREWKLTVLHDAFHKTHNFDVNPENRLAVGGAEGLVLLGDGEARQWIGEGSGPLESGGIGEVRFGPYPNTSEQSKPWFAAIEPMHGNQVVVYDPDKERTVLDDSLAEGHALVCGPFLEGNAEQVVAGWRQPDAQGKVGIRLYERTDDGWMVHTVDDDTMACEDLKAADLDGNGKLDLIAAGRATQNVVVYWNRN